MKRPPSASALSPLPAVFTVAILVAFGVACGRNEPVTTAPRPEAPPAPSVAPAAEPAVAAASGADGGSAPGGQLVSKALALPGSQGPAFLDYIAYERRNRRVWVPVGSTGSVDVLDTGAGTFTRVDGFKTVEREARGRKRTMGPSAVRIGDGVAYVGNRGTSEVCVIDVKTLQL